MGVSLCESDIVVLADQTGCSCTIRDENLDIEISIDAEEQIDAPEAESLSRAVFSALLSGPEGVDV